MKTLLLMTTLLGWAPTWTGSSTHPADSAADLDIDRPSPSRREFGIIPLVGGDSDVGLAVGTIGSVATFAPNARPYLWRAEMEAMLSFKHDKAGWNNPYQDYYVQFSIPSLAHNQVGMGFRLAYTQYNALKWYGLGNESTMNNDWMNAPTDSQTYILGKQYNQYIIAYPHASVDIQVRLARPWYLRAGLDYQYSEVNVYAGSKLDQDLKAGLIVGRGKFGVSQVSVSVLYDSRDEGMEPKHGAAHNLSVRMSPGGLRHMPYTFAGVDLGFRFYVSVIPKYVVLATRLVGDLLVGDVPFFYLAESADGYALGGGRGVRGIPAQRYSGKLKVYGNAELRYDFPSFTAFDQESIIGIVAFCDAGRLWADLQPDPNLDGRGIGIKYALGGGLRFRLGKTFLLRGDAAWSKDSAPVGFYFNVGQIF